MIGLAISGMGSPWTIVPAYRELENSLDVYENKNFDPEEVQDIISALFNATYALGGIVGPIFGAYMTQYTNFRTTADITAFILIGLGIT